jgi:hypothetical protein
MDALGCMHRDGTGVSKDIIKAQTFWEKAAQLGNTSSMNILGTLLVTGGEVGVRVTKNVPRGLALLREAISKGNSDAAFFLAQCHIKGGDIAQDLVEAERLFNLAAQTGLKAASNHAQITTVLRYINAIPSGTGRAVDATIHTAYSAAMAAAEASRENPIIGFANGVAAAFGTISTSYGNIFKTTFSAKLLSPAHFQSAYQAGIQAVWTAANQSVGGDSRLLRTR